MSRAAAARVQAQADLDEIGALIARASELLPAGSRYRPWLERIRPDLGDVASDLAASTEREPRIGRNRIAWLAAVYAEAWEALPPDAARRRVHSEAAIRLFFARAVSRDAARAARAEAALPRKPLAAGYLDGLGDVLLALARAVDADPGGRLRPRLDAAALARCVLRLRPRTTPLPA